MFTLPFKSLSAKYANMDEYGRMPPHKHRRAGFSSKLLMIGIIILIIVIAVFAYYFLGGPVNVTGPTNLAISSQGTVFALSGKSYVATLSGYNNHTNASYIYISSVPVFLGPVLNVTLHQNTTVKVNYNGQYAIMQLQEISGNKNSVNVKITPLSASLQVSPDYQYIGHPTVQLPGLNINTTTVVSTTTVPAGNSTTKTTTGSTVASTSTAGSTASTTTSPATNYTLKAIQAAIKTDENYGLIQNFTKLYNETPGCTAPIYNQSYLQQQGSMPPPPASYSNVSYETPYGMTPKIVSASGNSYNVEFLPLVKDPSFNGTLALEITVAVSSPGTASAIGTVSSDKYSGIFQGFTYASLSGAYSQSKSVNNDCAALV